jgi:two-component system sensor histidine kinase KdpD
MSGSSPTDLEASKPAAIIPKGKLKIFLGYAAGVGKTFQMLSEAQQLRQCGVDVVVGYFEPHARPDTIALLDGLEVIPRRAITYRGTQFTDMDTAAILRRAPRVCVVDEFAHTNVPGSQREKRWQDVTVLLEHGIDILTTVNVQHLESLNDQVYRMTGVRVRETVPDWVVQQADEVVMVDLTPRALLNRLDRGAVYQGEKAQRAKENFFKESTLVALRELALRETAFEVESRQNQAEPSKPQADLPTASEPDSSPHERVLVYVTPEPSAAALIRRAKRVADYMKRDCLAVAVCEGSGLEDLSPKQRNALEQNLAFARNLHVPTHIIKATNVAEELVAFARQHGVTQIYLLRPSGSAWRLPFKRDFLEQLSRLGRDMEVTIVAERALRR